MHDKHAQSKTMQGPAVQIEACACDHVSVESTQRVEVTGAVNPPFIVDHSQKGQQLKEYIVPDWLKPSLHSLDLPAWLKLSFQS